MSNVGGFNIWVVWYTKPSGRRVKIIIDKRMGPDVLERRMRSLIRGGCEDVVAYDGEWDHGMAVAAGKPLARLA